MKNMVSDAIPPLKPISVIICARNECENLKNYLPSVLEQDYPDFEVIVVNDRSWDGTADFLMAYAKRESRLKVVTVNEGEKFIAGKKFAVTMGIKAAAHEWLVFTDADCFPASPYWLSAMQQPVDDATEILLGYSPYLKRKNLLNVIIRLETFFTAVNYLSFALKGMPYMGVGRNMAYKKSLFFKGKGFASHMHIASGDDDLFVNAHANKYNTRVCIHPEAQIWSVPKPSPSAYIRQKKRHYGAGKFYRTSHRVILTAQFIFQIAFYVLGIIALCFPEIRYAVIGIFVANSLLRGILYARLFNRLSYPELKWWLPLLDWVLMLFLMLNALMSVFVKKQVQWK